MIVHATSSKTNVISRPTELLALSRIMGQYARFRLTPLEQRCFDLEADYRKKPYITDVPGAIADKLHMARSDVLDMMQSITYVQTMREIFEMDTLKPARTESLYMPTIRYKATKKRP